MFTDKDTKDKFMKYEIDYSAFIEDVNKLGGLALEDTVEAIFVKSPWFELISFTMLSSSLFILFKGLITASSIVTIITTK